MFFFILSKDCGKVTSTLNNGTITYYNNTKYGSKVEFKCDTGYTLYGDKGSECLADGKWNTYYVNCTIKGNAFSYERKMLV